MQVVMRFHEDLMLKDEKVRSILSTGIWWEHHGYCYPETEWIDNGNIILGWWLSAILRLMMYSDDETLFFMEGEYSLRLRINRNDATVQIALEEDDVTWTCSLLEIANAVCDATLLLCDELARLRIRESERAGLMKIVGEVRRALAE